MISGTELKEILYKLGINQSDFARLLGVTPRAVALWVTDERSVPGPAESYLRLFEVLPPNLRQAELARLKQKGKNPMRDGIFRITFQSPKGGAGLGMLVFENGRVYGSDSEGVRYDGGYIHHEETGLADVNLKITFPPNVQAVFGVCNPYEWAFDVSTSIDTRKDKGALKVKTSIGEHIDADYVFLRSLPDAA